MAKRKGIGAIKSKLRKLESQTMAALRAAQAKLIAPLQRQYDKHQREAERIGAIIAGVLGSNHKATATHSNAPARSVKRKRRSTSDLANLASKVSSFIKAAGEKGVGGGDIHRRFGKLIPTPGKFLATHG